MMKKVELNHPLFEELPTPIIWDILSRLPTKACLNCKLVCKDWYQIIIDPDFADLRSSHRLYFTVWLYGKFNNGRRNFLLLDVDKASQVDEIGNLNFNADAMIKFNSKLNVPHHKLFMVNECNGLICLKSRKKWDPYFICNLLTGQQVIVEQTHVPSCLLELLGFGCCPVSHQYKVLRILKMGNGKNVATIQTLGSNEWRVIGDAPLCDRFHSNTSATFLHGLLHWYSYKGNCIWSFHFGNEQFLQIPTPDDMIREYRKSISVFDSCLCFTTIRSLCEVWVMKEYGVKDSWVKQFVFEYNNLYMFLPYVPLLQMGNGEILVSDLVRLKVYDIYCRSYRRLQFSGLSSFQVFMCDAKFSKLIV